ncbi:unnamed protein product, partial [Ascophyllum nodosum]
MTDSINPPPPPPPREDDDASDDERDSDADGEEDEGDGVAMASSAAAPAATVAAVAVAAPAQTAGGKRSPSDFLKTVLGRAVVVKLNSGIDYRGVLVCLDGYMNIAMEQT